MGAGRLWATVWLSAVVARVQQARWSELVQGGNGVSPGPRMSSMMLSRGSDSLYLFGGMDDQKQVLDDFWRYDTEKKAWTEEAADEGAGKRCWSAMAINEEGTALFIFGGFDGQQNLNDLWKFSFKKKTWKLITPRSDVPLPRDRHAMVMVTNSLFVFGGYTTTYNGEFWQYNVDNNEWSEMQASAPGTDGPGKRRSHAACMHAGRMFVLGGHTSGGKVLADAWAFDFGLGEWASVGFPLRRTESAVFSNGMTKALVFGGHDGANYRHDLWVREDDDDWELMDPNGDRPVERANHCGALHRSKKSIADRGALYVYGGYDGQDVLADMHKLNLATSTWSKVG